MIGPRPNPKNRFAGATPVSVEIVYSDDFLSDMMIVDESALRLAWLDPVTGEWSVVPGSAVDRAASRVTAQVSHFFWYTPIIDELSSLAEGARAILECLTVTYTGIFPDSFLDTVNNLIVKASQPRRFIGAPFRPWEKNVLLVHGIFRNAWG